MNENFNYLKSSFEQIQPDWHHFFRENLAKLQEIDNKLTNLALNNIIFPPAPLTFNAFIHTSLNDLKVVAIGQDPYHGAGEAIGLAFSVNKGVRVPPSQEIFLVN